VLEHTSEKVVEINDASRECVRPSSIGAVLTVASRGDFAIVMPNAKLASFGDWKFILVQPQTVPSTKAQLILPSDKS